MAFARSGERASSETTDRRGAFVSWGVFDSGVGGLTVVHALLERLPNTSLVYLGDTARVPYGIRSVETVRGYAREALRFFLDAAVDGLIVACNTASAVALDIFEEAIDGPVIGVVVPGVHEALSETATHRVGVIGTQATIRSQAYAQRIRELSPRTHVVAAACPLFVPLAEEGWIDGDVPRLVAARYLAPLREARVDTVILGCTHYPLLAGVIGEEMGEGVTLVDSASAVAREAARRETDARVAQVRTAPTPAPQHRFCVTDGGGSFANVASLFLGERLTGLETVELHPHP
ncbi:MAG: glutamate racemase [Acidobacteriota bacterium]|nr:MAG: glutamate racemase [Acidobacteriota bacterium]